MISQIQYPRYEYIRYKYLRYKILRYKYLRYEYLRDGPLFFPVGYRDFQEAGNFFCHRLSTFKIFFSTHCVDNFFKFPKFRITGVASADNFFGSTSGADNLFQQIFSSRYLPGKNNGPFVRSCYQKPVLRTKKCVQREENNSSVVEN